MIYRHIEKRWEDTHRVMQFGWIEFELFQRNLTIFLKTCYTCGSLCCLSK